MKKMQKHNYSTISSISLLLYLAIDKCLAELLFKNRFNMPDSSHLGEGSHGYAVQYSVIKTQNIGIFFLIFFPFANIVLKLRKIMIYKCQKM